jgi:hypothetical protein
MITPGVVFHPQYDLNTAIMKDGERLERGLGGGHMSVMGVVWLRRFFLFSLDEIATRRTQRGMLKLALTKGSDKSHHGDSIGANKRAESEASLFSAKKAAASSPHQLSVVITPRRRARCKSESFHNSWDYANDFVQPVASDKTTSGEQQDQNPNVSGTAPGEPLEKINNAQEPTNVAPKISVQSPTSPNTSRKPVEAEEDHVEDPRLKKDEVDRQLEDMEAYTSCDEEIEAKPKKRKKKTFKSKRASGSDGTSRRVVSPIKKIPAHRSKRTEEKEILSVPASDGSTSPRKQSSGKSSKRKSSPSKSRSREISSSSAPTDTEAQVDTDSKANASAPESM